MKYNPEVEAYRTTHHFLPPTNKGDLHGFFEIPFRSNNLRVMSSGTTHEWEHVSVSLHNRCPNWEEMCLVKSLFWSDDETVIQFHPKKTDYVNRHPYCLHLWKLSNQEHVLPPTWTVG